MLVFDLPEQSLNHVISITEGRHEHDPTAFASFRVGLFLWVDWRATMGAFHVVNHQVSRFCVVVNAAAHAVYSDE